MIRLTALLRAVVCALQLMAPQAAHGPAFARAGAIAALAAPVAQEKDESCGRGKATREFGWKVVRFGIDTLKYLIGLFIIPIGLFLVVIGALLEVVEAVVC